MQIKIHIWWALKVQQPCKFTIFYSKSFFKIIRRVAETTAIDKKYLCGGVL